MYNSLSLPSISISLLSSFLTTITFINAYPTQSPLSLGLPSQGSAQDTDLSNLYTPTPHSPSRSGTLSLTSPLPLIHTTNPPPNRQTVSLPFTLTSTCAALVPDWSCLSSDVLTQLLRTYPEGPTSSPYYGFVPASSSSSSVRKHDKEEEEEDKYILSSTIILPSQISNLSWRSRIVLTLRAAPASSSPSSSPRTTKPAIQISKPSWHSLIGLLHSSNAGLFAETSGTGFGRLVISGVMPGASDRSTPHSTPSTLSTYPASTSTNAIANSQQQETKYAPSDIILPHPLSNQQQKEQEAYSWHAEWTYYGVITGSDGVERVVECDAMPAGLEPFVEEVEEMEEVGKVGKVNLGVKGAVAGKEKEDIREKIDL